MGNRSNIKSFGNQLTGQNLGTGDACLYITKSENRLQFRSISATGVIQFRYFRQMKIF